MKYLKWFTSFGTCWFINQTIVYGKEKEFTIAVSFFIAAVAICILGKLVKFYLEFEED